MPDLIGHPVQNHSESARSTRKSKGAASISYKNVRGPFNMLCQAVDVVLLICQNLHTRYASVELLHTGHCT